MQTLKPTANRVTVVETKVDEEQLESGLIVPLVDKDSPEYQRGVVLDVGPTDLDHRLERGWVVFYRRGVKVGGVVVVDVLDVIAYIDTED